LVPTHSTDAAVISLKSKLEDVWGDDGLHLMKGWTP